MVAAAGPLIWEVTKNNSSFLRKRNGKTKRSGKVEFSVEKGNLVSLNQHKYSGHANAQVYNIRPTADGGAELVKKNTKADVSPRDGVTVISVNPNNFRKVEKTLKNTTSNVFYRRDLEAKALGKLTKVYQSAKVVKGVKKGTPPKMGRGTL